MVLECYGYGTGAVLAWHSYVYSIRMVLVGYWVYIDMAMALYWYATGIVRYWYGIGMVLIWYWNDIGMV